MTTTQLTELRRVRSLLLAHVIAPKPWTQPERIRAMAEVVGLLGDLEDLEEQRQREESAIMFLEAVRAMSQRRG